MAYKVAMMKSYLSILLLFLGFFLFGSPMQPLEIDSKEPPPRIIRTCCAFGSDLKLFGIPYAKLNQITSMEKLNEHKYMGDKNEGIGLLYAKKGGFIDLGHVRDQADWTKYLYSLILANREDGEFVQKLAYEGGKKSLTVDASSDLDSADCLLLSAKIAYDISLWHEMSTWFGASALPLIPEQFSSFSVEDVYSNLLGIYIGMEALKSSLPYDDAMTAILYQTLDSLDAVAEETDTYLALEAVRESWWTRDKRLPRNGVIIERDLDVQTDVRPWLVPDSTFGFFEPKILTVPKTTAKGELLTDYYNLNIDLNYKFPVKEIFPERDNRIISEEDFNTILIRIEEDFKKLK